VFEIWPVEGGWRCIYSENRELCKRLARSNCTEWFGTYTKDGKWLAEQYRFPVDKANFIKNITKAVA